MKGIPSLRLGDVSKTPDPQPSSDSQGKPKLGFGGFGLDLTKAKNFQQENLAKID